MLSLSGATAHPLSFVKINPDLTRNFWAPTRTGDYAVDCDQGRRYAVELQEYIAENRSATIYTSICRAMTEGGEYGGVEIGFSTGIGIIVCGAV